MAIAQVTIDHIKGTVMMDFVTTNGSMVRANKVTNLAGVSICLILVLSFPLTLQRNDP